eukprot:scaffold249344_cov41-Cyclotella_meneghiniana.AAC.1
MPTEHNVLILESKKEGTAGNIINMDSDGNNIGGARDTTSNTERSSDMIRSEQNEMMARLGEITEYMNWDGDKAQRYEPKNYHQYFHPMRMDDTLTLSWHASQYDRSDNMNEIMFSSHMYLLLSNDGRFYVGLADNLEKLKKFIYPKREVWNVQAIVDGLRALEPEVYTFMADQAKISLLNTDEGGRLQKGLSMIAEWIANGEDTGIRVVSLQRYPCEEETAETIKSLQHSKVALAQNGVAYAPKRQREQQVSTAVTPASCNDRDKSKTASKNKDSNEIKKARRGSPKDPQDYEKKKETKRSTPFLAPRPQPMNSRKIHNVSPPEAKASTLSLAPAPQPMDSTQMQHATPAKAKAIRPSVTPNVPQAPQTPVVSTTNANEFSADDKQANTPVISAPSTTNFLADDNQASVTSGLTADSCNGTPKFDNGREHSPRHGHEYSSSQKHTFHPHYYSSPKYNDTGSVADSFVSISEKDMPTEEELPFVSIKTSTFPTYMLRSHSDYNSLCGLCGVLIELGDWIEKLYIRKDNLKNRRPSGYWCCVDCPKQPVPGLTMVYNEAIGERHWNPRNGYFCRWNGIGDTPRFYKWDGNRTLWKGSLRCTYQPYNNNDWRSSPQYGEGVKQEYNPGVGQVINATKHNVNTSGVLNNQNQKSLTKEDIIQNICDDAITYADNQRKNSGSCSMWDALQGVKDKYSEYEDLVWDAGRVLQITWPSTNDPLHNNSVDKPSKTNKDKGRGSNTVFAATKRQRPFDT